MNTIRIVASMFQSNVIQCTMRIVIPGFWSIICIHVSYICMYVGMYVYHEDCYFQVLEDHVYTMRNVVSRFWSIL